MNRSKKVSRLVIPDPAPPPAFPNRGTSRRVLQRVETGAMAVQAGVHADGALVEGRLLDVSVAGCCVRLPVPLPPAIGEGLSTKVTLHAEKCAITCAAQVVALNRETDVPGVVDVHLRFRALPLETHRALLDWITLLARRHFQMRYALRQHDRTGQ